MLAVHTTTVGLNLTLHLSTWCDKEAEEIKCAETRKEEAKCLTSDLTVHQKKPKEFLFLFVFVLF